VLTSPPVPPEIVEDWMSTNIEVREGDTVELTCNATGVPLPVVTWYKEKKLISEYSDRIGGTCVVMQLFGGYKMGPTLTCVKKKRNIINYVMKKTYSLAYF